MSLTKFTEKQQEAITSSDCEILVSAAAGSGKTTVMIERVIGLLRGGASLENMAICTFTKVAAADMKTKLGLRLAAAEGENPRFAAQLKILPQSDISTIHSWCAKIIKTYFYAADADPNFEIMPEAVARLEKAAATERIIEREIKNGDPDFLQLYDILLANRKHKTLVSLIGKIYEYAAVQPSPEDWLKSCETAIEPHSLCLRQLAEHYARLLKRIQQRAKRIEFDLTAAGCVADYDCIRQLLESIEFCLTSDLKILPELDKIKSMSKNSEHIDLHERLKMVRDSYKKWSTDCLAALGLPDAALTLRHTAVLVRMARAVTAEFIRRKAARAYLDYGDLEHETLKILKSVYGGEVRDKYRYVFIDEYQDTNPLQNEILQCFKDNVFFVGDVKQSIYGFRMCAPEFFVAKRAQYLSGGGGCSIELNANFRSDDGILQLCNRVFSRVMTLPFGQVDYAASGRFDEGAHFSDNSVTARIVRVSPSSEPIAREGIYSVKNHDFSADAEHKSEYECNLILEHILSLVGSGVIINGEPREVEFGDIAVLVRSREGLAARLIKKLKSADIPCGFTDSGSADGYRSIELLNAYLRLIDNNRDDVNLAAVMLSCFGGFSDGELAEIARGASDGESFFEAVYLFGNKKNGDSALSARVKEFMQRLEDYCEKSDSLSVCDLAGHITGENDYFKYVLGELGSEEAEALAAYLSDLDGEEGSLYEFICALDSVSPEVKVSADPSAVKLMTIHAAKGLEFPFVILPDLQHKFNFYDLSAPMILSRGGISLKYYDEAERYAFTTAQMEVEKLALKRRQLEEEMRILYVALTRAKFGLALFATVAPSADEADGESKSADDAVCFLDWLKPDLGFAEYIGQADCVRLESAPRQSAVFSRADPTLTKKIAERLAFSDSYNHRALKTSVTRLMGDGLEETLNSTPYSAGAYDDRAQERGTAYHKLMESLDFFADFDGEWERLQLQYPVQALLCKKEELRLAAKNMSELTRGAEVLRERQFVLCSNENGAEAELIQGVIDVIAVFGDGAVIVDYKTTRAESLNSEGYPLQLKYYALAVEKILGLKIKRKTVYSFALGEFIDM